MRLVDPPIYEANARVCSKHFAEACYVLSVLEGFGPLKLDAVPTIFTFTSPPKCRKLSEARQAKAKHRDVMKELMENDATEADSEPVHEATTRDVGTQCGKLSKSTCMVQYIIVVEL